MGISLTAADLARLSPEARARVADALTAHAGVPVTLGGARPPAAVRPRRRIRPWVLAVAGAMLAGGVALSWPRGSVHAPSPTAPTPTATKGAGPVHLAGAVPAIILPPPPTPGATVCTARGCSWVAAGKGE